MDGVRVLCVLLILFMPLLLASCNSKENNTANFKEEDIKIQLKQQFNNDYFVGYVIEVKNKSELTISYLNMYVNLPILTKEGSKENSFVLVGTPHKEENHLESGGKLEYTFEGFVEVLDLNKIDVKSPIVKFTGYVEGEVPFALSHRLETTKVKKK
ncbi:hypothetical protein [Lysinibacillus sp. BW-2-10]|uniref:hypothetical protein n=1 Tax=Lysinibacillus sp. BW-2-10 TaxID=2590030 RepID=UPI0011803B60|nr:hypothetical protein [Lysinibacillus sp. BW-2-10]TSI11781.1 hypothetical protein FJQ64_00225 [Lysinibacillus sp. BW-2-10]